MSKKLRNPKKNMSTGLPVTEPDYLPEDPVNHPSHYADGKIECIDAIDTVTLSMSGEPGYYTGTILKYIWRWNKKHGVQDLKKARWYLNRLILKLDPTDKGS